MAAPAAASAGAATGPTDGDRPFRIVAVTSCPTGIAHTYMAAESLENAGREAGVEIVVETQGSAGFTRLDPAVIAAADGVILAHDVPVRDKQRFAGKPTVDTGVKAAVNRPAALITEVRDKAARGETTEAAPVSTPVERAGADGEGYGTLLRRWLMSGVSYMVPFVAAGGLLIALGFAIGGYEINEAPSVMDHFVWTQADSWGALLLSRSAASPSASSSPSSPDTSPTAWPTGPDSSPASSAAPSPSRSTPASSAASPPD